MVRIISAPFHPDLEEALVSELRALKHADPLQPLAILTPSQQLARRVKWFLSVEKGLALLDVYVLTFHQLALTLLQEANLDLPLLVNATFREELLRSLVSRQLPGLEIFRARLAMRGMWSGLWASIQDLKEARVDPATAMAAVEEGLLGTDDRARLRALFRLYAACMETDRALHIADPDDLATLALEVVPRSCFLKRLGGIFYYGVYDLTQGQLDFFRAIADSYPATVFFPLRQGSPAYRFAQQFFATYLQGMAEQPPRGNNSSPQGYPLLFNCDGSTREGRVRGNLADEMIPEVRSMCRLFSAAGHEDEVSAVAKEIVRLIEDQKLQPMEIGVVARSLEPYLPSIRRVFDENRIPFACPLGTPLLHEPLVKTIAHFITLRVEAFPRAGVLEVLTSPACRLTALCATGIAPRPDQWDWVSRYLGITRGNPEDGSLGEWRWLERAAQRGLHLPGDEDSGKPDIRLDPEQLGLLWDLVRRLHADLSALPESARWEEYTDAFTRLLPLYFELPAWEQAEPADRAETVQVAIRDCVGAARALEVLAEEISLREWAEFMVEVLERAFAPSETRDVAGVQVLDAMDARGMPFRALFVLGMNEKVFPRSVQEDAFLRDAEREVLNTDLGFKVARKLDGFDEERLLFALLLRSAREQLYLSYQRSDHRGRPMAASGYVAELARDLWGPAAIPSGSSLKGEARIARRPSRRWMEWPYAPLLLTPREMGIYAILSSSAHQPALAFSQTPELLEEGLKAQAAIEAGSAVLTPYDGVIGPDHPYWRVLQEKGISPTALQHYAQCPFRYFAGDVLRLDPFAVSDSVMELDARSRGMLCHKILCAFFQRLARSQVQPADLTDRDIEQWLAEETARAFGAYEADEPVGYPVLWSVAKESLTALLLETVRSELRELNESGYVPTFFELDMKGQFGASAPAWLQRVPIHGVLDRVDIKRENGQVHVRVVDYKYTEGSKPKDCNLPIAALRGLRLQPPLYLQIAEQVLAGEHAVADAVVLRFLAPNWETAPEEHRFTVSASDGTMAPCLAKTVPMLLDGIRQGRFAILPVEAYCERCDFASACRRHHGPTDMRAREDSYIRTLKDLRKMQLGEPMDKDNA